MIQPTFPMIKRTGFSAFPMVGIAVRSHQKVATIQRAVANMFDLNMSDMVSARRHRPAAHARQVAMYLARELTAQSLPDIGRRFGNRDHTTVMHGIGAVEARMTTDADLRADIDALREELAA